MPANSGGGCPIVPPELSLVLRGTRLGRTAPLDRLQKGSPCGYRLLLTADMTILRRLASHCRSGKAFQSVCGNVLRLPQRVRARMRLLTTREEIELPLGCSSTLPLLSVLQRTL